MNDREIAADQILTAMETLVVHPAYCRDIYDPNGTCTMPHAHTISRVRAWALYQIICTWADTYVTEGN